MGAWGIKTFENDDALDWLYELEESSDLSVIEATLDEASSDYLEAPEGCNILAAAEVILALCGKPNSGLPENVIDWASANRNLDIAHLIERATKAIDRILSGKSELNDLWQDSENDYRLWVDDVSQIKQALQSIEREEN